MMAFISKFIAFFLSVLAFFGIYIDNPYDKDVDTSTMTTEIIVNEDNTVTAKLEANPTTGYQWTYDIISGSAELKEEKYESSSTSTEIVGAGGTKYYTFEFPADGTTEIEFQYLRSWEDCLPACKFKLTVVTENGVVISNTKEFAKYDATDE